MAEHAQHGAGHGGHGHEDHGHGAGEHAHQHPNYVRIWFVLLVLLAVSILGPMVGIKIVTLLTAFGIAIVKAYLVAKNFMHIDIAARYVTYIVVTLLVFVFLFFAGTAPDVMKPQGRNWVKPAWIDGTAHPPGAAHEAAPAHEEGHAAH